MPLPKNKQITLKRGESCQITLPDGRMLEVSSTGKLDLIAMNGNTLVADLPDVQYGEIALQLVSSLIGENLTRY